MPGENGSTEGPKPERAERQRERHGWNRRLRQKHRNFSATDLLFHLGRKRQYDHDEGKVAKLDVRYPTVLGGTARLCIYGLIYVALRAIVPDLMLPGARLSALLLIWVCSIALGEAFEMVKLPKALGMLVAGLILANLPAAGSHSDHLDAPEHNLAKYWSKQIRAGAMALVLLRAGLSLDLASVIGYGWKLVALATIPSVIEALLGAAIATGIFGMPYAVGLIMSFMVSAVGPAIVVSGCMSAKEAGFAPAAPNFLTTVTCFDDATCIIGFNCVLHAFISTGGDPVWNYLIGPMNLILGVVGGAIAAGFCSLTALWSTPGLRSSSLFFTSMLLIYVAEEHELLGAGAISNIVLGILTRHAWSRAWPRALISERHSAGVPLTPEELRRLARRREREQQREMHGESSGGSYGGSRRGRAQIDEKHEADGGPGPVSAPITAPVAMPPAVGGMLAETMSSLNLLWYKGMYPLLFGLIGASLRAKTIDKTLASSAIGYAFAAVGIRFCAALSVTMFFKSFTARERVYMACAWVAKATTQAAFATVPLETFQRWSELHPGETYAGTDGPGLVKFGVAIQTTCVMSIFIGTPLATLLMTLGAPRLLGMDPAKQEAAAAAAAAHGSMRVGPHGGSPGQGGSKRGHGGGSKREAFLPPIAPSPRPASLDSAKLSPAVMVPAAVAAAAAADAFVVQAAMAANGVDTTQDHDQPPPPPPPPPDAAVPEEELAHPLEDSRRARLRGASSRGLSEGALTAFSTSVATSVPSTTSSATDIRVSVGAASP